MALARQRSQLVLEIQQLLEILVIHWDRDILAAQSHPGYLLDPPALKRQRHRGIQVLLVVLEVHKDLVVLERQLLLEIQESRADLFDPADPPDLRAPVVQINLEIQAGPLDQQDRRAQAIRRLHLVQVLPARQYYPRALVLLESRYRQQHQTPGNQVHLCLQLLLVNQENQWGP